MVLHPKCICMHGRAGERIQSCKHIGCCTCVTCVRHLGLAFACRCDSAPRQRQKRAPASPSSFTPVRKSKRSTTAGTDAQHIHHNHHLIALHAHICVQLQHVPCHVI